ncbi:lipid droplet phospholipase 1 [[Candida] anglica]
MGSYHLIVLVHGLWGNYSNMQYLQSQIESQGEDVVVYKTGSHSGFLTYDGIDVNGKRVCDEIMSETQRLTDGDHKVTKISIVGYSLGGLIARYAIGVLHSLNYFESIEPIHFVTFCSPHVGVLTPNTGIAARLFNFVVPYFLAHSGSQMFLTDRRQFKVPSRENINIEKRQLPLLVWMAEPQSFFFKALAKFKHRSLYANIINDKRTCWFTSAISIMDPFQSMSNESCSIYDLDYVPGYEPTVIDIKKPITIIELNENEETKFESSIQNESWISNFLRRKLNWVKVLGKLVIFTPIWAGYFVCRSILERIKLNRRVSTFFHDASNNLLHLYDYEEADEDDLSSEKSDTNNFAISDRLSLQTDGLIESVFDAINSEKYSNHHYLVSSHDKENHNDSDPGLAKFYSAISDSIQSSQDQINTKVIEQIIPNLEFELKLSLAQRIIIKNLNSLSWDKFPVLIRNTKATHAAVIVKIEDPDYEEGKTVVKHFVEQVLTKL